MNIRHRIAIVLAVALLVPVAATRASDSIGKETGAACTACHDKPGSKRLTDRGKYFELMQSFDGYDQLRTSFGRCTSCHVRNPGSKKLTRRGQQLAEQAKDMHELREWIRAGHPTPPAK